MVSRKSEGIEDLRDKIWKLYEEKGLPRHIAAGWALPEVDTYDLIHVLGQRSPKKILEIGSYVGITTNLLAAFLPGDVRIDAIDPNQPLAVEDGAMGQTERLTMRPFDLGLAVAKELDVEHKVFWHEGGSSTVKTFATENGMIESTIPLIGNDVCSAHGPFDFIFIDALHYEFAVQADLELAVQWLAPDGIIAVHDVLGRWGSHVRRALHKFLTDHTEFIFSHFPYGEQHHALGFLTRKGEAGVRLPISPAEPQNGLWQRPMVDACCAWIKGHLRPRQVLFVGPDAHHHAATLALQGHAVTHVALDAAAGCDHLPWDEKGPLPFLPEVDLCICLHAALPRVEGAESLIASLCECSPRVLLSASPPGEFGVAHENALSVQRWLQLFSQKNYIGTDLPLQQLDPWFYAIYNNLYAPTNSYALLTWLFERSSEPITDHMISQCGRSASMVLDSLAMNIILMNSYRKIQDAGVEHQKWIFWKDQVDERELQWMDYKKNADERELMWMDYKNNADERELKYKRQADERELQYKRLADERELQWRQKSLIKIFYNKIFK